MKRKIVLLVCLCVAWAGLAAETVMVSIREGEKGSGGDKTKRYCLSALEDGIMEEFFLAGHIVFNERLPSGGTSERLSVVRLAKEGGASRLVRVELFFQNVGEGIFRPERIEYSLFRVADQEILAEGGFPAREVERPAGMSVEEYCAGLGREIGRRLISGR